MNRLDDDIRKVLANGESVYDLEKEEGVFRQMAGIFRGKMRWMAIAVTIECVVFVVLIVLAGIEFFQADEVSQRSADLTGANQCDFVARHGKSIL